MAITATVAAVASAGTAAYAANQQKVAAGRAQEAQAKAASEQKAVNASQFAQEQRQQIREERVRRARILQTSQNTGTAFSSGEAGAIGGMATQLSSNIGTNLAMKAASQQISLFNQQAADAQYDYQKAGQLFSLASSIFSATAPGAMKAVGGTGTKTTTDFIP